MTPSGMLVGEPCLSYWYTRCGFSYLLVCAGVASNDGTVSGASRRHGKRVLQPRSARYLNRHFLSGQLLKTPLVVQSWLGGLLRLGLFQ